MELELKPDFAQARLNWDLFWKGKLRRPVLLLTVPKEGVTPAAKPPWGAARTMSAKEVCDQALRWAETHEFLGEAVPYHTPSIIIGLWQAVMGAEVQFVHEEWGVDTRVVPFIDNLHEFEARLDKESEWWAKWVELVETMKQELAGRMVFGEAFPGQNLDHLSAMRGTTQMLMDFYDDPDGVPQSDAAFSISKEHFVEFGLPYLKREIARLDHVEYHLDGPGNLTHLETICAPKGHSCHSMGTRSRRRGKEGLERSV